MLPKGIWRRHTAPLLTTEMLIDQQLYRLALPPGISPTVAAALLNSAWFMLQCELQGRINFGAGLLWLAAYELGATRLPDPRHLPPEAISTLEDRFAALAQRPIRPIDEELQQPDRQALDTAVFDLLAFSAAERTAVLDALQERLLTRQRRAAAQPT